MCCCADCRMKTQPSRRRHRRSNRLNRSTLTTNDVIIMSSSSSGAVQRPTLTDWSAGSSPTPVSCSTTLSCPFVQLFSAEKLKGFVSRDVS